MILIYLHPETLDVSAICNIVLSLGWVSRIGWVSADAGLEEEHKAAMVVAKCHTGIVTTFERAVALIYSRTCEPRRPWIHITRDAVLVAQAREAGVEVYST